MDRKTTSEILHRIYAQAILLQSDFARRYDWEIAALASLGLITTKIGPFKFGRTWRVTAEGLIHLKEEGYL
jgi:hypothetical protein